MDRDKLRAQFGDSSNGPSIHESNVMAQPQNPTQSINGLQVEITQAQSVSLDTGLEAIRTSDVANTEPSLSFPTSARSEPGFLSCLQCD